MVRATAQATKAAQCGTHLVLVMPVLEVLHLGVRMQLVVVVDAVHVCVVVMLPLISLDLLLTQALGLWGRDRYARSMERGRCQARAPLRSWPDDARCQCDRCWCCCWCCCVAQWRTC